MHTKEVYNSSHSTNQTALSGNSRRHISALNYLYVETMLWDKKISVSLVC